MNENQLNDVNEKENTVAIWDILLSISGKWWLILLVAIVFGSIATVYVDSTYVDVYRSYGSIYLVSKNEAIFEISDINYAGTMMEDYIYRISTEENMRNAVARLPDEIRAVYTDADISEEELEAYISRVTASMTWSSLREATSISNPEDTHYLYISVVSTDPRLSYAAANAVIGASLESLQNFFGVEEVDMDEQPRLPTGPSSAKSYQRAYLAALIGAALVIGILVILYLRDDKINTAEDVEKYLGLTVLAMIPEGDFAEFENEGEGKKKQRGQL